jgi:hypothetical protein
MRPVPTLAAVLIAAAFGREHAAAQRVGATVEVAATVVETPGVRVDPMAATVAATRREVRIAVPLAVSGAGSPSVAVASDGGERECRAVSSATEPAAPWLRCSVPRRAAPAGAVTEIRVTLVIVPAT